MSIPADGELVALLEECGAHALAEGVGRHRRQQRGRGRVPSVAHHVGPDAVSLQDGGSVRTRSIYHLFVIINFGETTLN